MEAGIIVVCSREALIKIPESVFREGAVCTVQSTVRGKKALVLLYKKLHDISVPHNKNEQREGCQARLTAQGLGPCLKEFMGSNPIPRMNETNAQKY